MMLLVLITCWLFVTTDRDTRARREHRAHACVQRRDAQLLRQGAARDRLAHCDSHERVRELYALGT